MFRKQQQQQQRQLNNNASTTTATRCTVTRGIQVMSVLAFVVWIYLSYSYSNDSNSVMSIINNIENQATTTTSLHQSVVTETLTSQQPILEQPQAARNNTLGQGDVENDQSLKPLSSQSQTKTKESITTDSSVIEATNPHLPEGFQRMLARAQEMSSYCQTKLDETTTNASVTTDTNGKNKNNPYNQPTLPSLGIIDALKSYRPENENANINKNEGENSLDWQCQLPPETECQETKFTVIIMGYNPDRLRNIRKQIRSMLSIRPYRDHVAEVVLVWNNLQHESLANVPSQVAKTLHEWTLPQHNHFVAASSREPNPFRIWYPRHELHLDPETNQHSSLLNRYHPYIRPKTNALLYYDDDGPFYAFRAIWTAFELWKRNSRYQLGAMARTFTLTPDQEEEKRQKLNKIVGEMDDNDKSVWRDDVFVSSCPSSTSDDELGNLIAYDYRFFVTFHANMVLPSGSFLHRNYLCFIWHPALQQLRSFVNSHVVHPDDMTVSMVVSHVNGHAPLPYSRRIRPEENQKSRRRRLQLSSQEDVKSNMTLFPTDGEVPLLFSDDEEETVNIESMEQEKALWQQSQRRRLSSINSTSPHGMWKTQDWGNLRSHALQQVVGYMGSVTSGSRGWCFQTPTHTTTSSKQRWKRKDQDGQIEEYIAYGRRHVCEPEMARLSQIPWIQQHEGGTTTTADSEKDAGQREQQHQKCPHTPIPDNLF